MRKIIIYFSLCLTISLCLTGCTLFDKVKETSFFNSEQSNSNNNDTTNNSSSNKNSSVDDNSNKNSTNKKTVTDYNDKDNEITSWFYMPNDTHTTPDINPKLTYDLSNYNAIYNGHINESTKTLYLTFDEGYENGYTSKILDVLKEKNVKAVFFVTSYYLEKNPDLVKRMVDEGHVVGNHSETHSSMPTLTSDMTKFKEEFSDVESKYKEITGLDMKKFFRPPMGYYSERSLAMTNDLGYKTVFWSFAYDDWDPEKQPEVNYAKNKILDNLHNGSILLLHAVSKTNTEILGDVVDSARDAGYEFKLLN